PARAVQARRLTTMNGRWPKAVEDGLIPTDDAMGIMTEEPSPAAEAFIELAGRAGRPLLEIGAAYGNATLPALRAGGRGIANDLSASELGVLASGASGEERKRLVLMPARFPEEIRLGDGCLSGALAAQVLHFFDGPTVELAFQSVRRWLEPGGAWYVVVMTPSLGFYRTLRPEYEKQARPGRRRPAVFPPPPPAPRGWRSGRSRRWCISSRRTCCAVARRRPASAWKPWSISASATFLRGTAPTVTSSSRSLRGDLLPRRHFDADEGRR